MEETEELEFPGKDGKMFHVGGSCRSSVSSVERERRVRTEGMMGGQKGGNPKRGGGCRSGAVGLVRPDGGLRDVPSEEGISLMLGLLKRT